MALFIPKHASPERRRLRFGHNGHPAVSPRNTQELRVQRCRAGVRRTEARTGRVQAVELVQRNGKQPEPRIPPRPRELRWSMGCWFSSHLLLRGVVVHHIYSFWGCVPNPPDRRENPARANSLYFAQKVPTVLDSKAGTPILAFNRS